MNNNSLILGQDHIYSLDCYKTKVNNNVLVVGTAGSGKTRGLVIPNILQATGSYIISDPKGQLYREYAGYLAKQGYVIKVLDLIQPKRSTLYNFFSYIKTDRDIIKAGKMLTKCLCKSNEGTVADPFWDESAEMLLTSIISYLVHNRPMQDRTIRNICSLLMQANVDENFSDSKTHLDNLMESATRQDLNSFTWRQYSKFRVGAGKTLKSILISLNTRFKSLDFEEIHKMTAKDNMHIQNIGAEKTAVFVIISDMERSMDPLANLFYSQCLEVLCTTADRVHGGKLPYDVRFILDDFATNCVIDDFPKKISAFRSRGISTMLMLQAEPQLEACYPREGNIIIGNCDNYIYLGGNDLDTAESIAKRCNIPTDEILNMPIGSCWIIRRGQKPVMSNVIDLDDYIKKNGFIIPKYTKPEFKYR